MLQIGLDPSSLLWEVESAKQIVQAIEQKQTDVAATKLRHLASNACNLPPLWLLKLADCLETGEWSLLSEGFINMEFIGKNGYFLHLAPYRYRRENQWWEELSAIYGQIQDYQEPSIEQMENLCYEMFGKLRQPIPRNLSFNCIASCGGASGENGEAFVVPNGWLFPNSVLGPPLNNADEQRRRFLGNSRECLYKIFTEETANLLLAPLEDEVNGDRYRHMDTQTHEAGHAAGLGFYYKVNRDLLSQYSYSAVEEWRADSLGFEFAARTLAPEEAGKLVAVNFCIRFGLDAHRLGGLNRDVDVNASILSLEYLFQSDAIYITRKGQLSLRDLSYPGLLRAVEMHRAQAINLTRRELNLNVDSGLLRLYKIDIHPSTQAVFQMLVERSGGIWQALR